ncbi:MAG: hypothetical protein ACQR33_04390 [Candidatus Saccharibacteria bacterium]
MQRNVRAATALVLVLGLGVITAACDHKTTGHGTTSKTSSAKSSAPSRIAAPTGVVAHLDSPACIDGAPKNLVVFEVSGLTPGKPVTLKSSVISLAGTADASGSYTFSFHCNFKPNTYNVTIKDVATGHPAREAFEVIK